MGFTKAVEPMLLSQVTSVTCSLGFWEVVAITVMLNEVEVTSNTSKNVGGRLRTCLDAVNRPASVGFVFMMEVASEDVHGACFSSEAELDNASLLDFLKVIRLECVEEVVARNECKAAARRVVSTVAPKGSDVAAEGDAGGARFVRAGECADGVRAGVSLLEGREVR